MVVSFNKCLAMIHLTSLRAMTDIVINDVIHDDNIYIIYNTHVFKPISSSLKMGGVKNNPCVYIEKNKKCLCKGGPFQGLSREVQKIFFIFFAM
jgi:hypothetical protein